ncbi:MAG: T9SS type A sorting domain-containing protein [Fulvivirga sp.]
MAALYVKSLNSYVESLSENSINLTASPILSSSSQVYPNPLRSGQSVRLSTSNQSIGQVINVKNENGRLIGTYNLSKNHSEIVINGLKKGSYFVEFRSNEDVRTERLIVLD